MQVACQASKPLQRLERAEPSAENTPLTTSKMPFCLWETGCGSSST